jgi:hypothetical protein
MVLFCYGSPDLRDMQLEISNSRRPEPSQSAANPDKKGG